MVFVFPFLISNTLEFEDYIEPLKVYLARYREIIFLFSFASFFLGIVFDGFYQILFLVDLNTSQGYMLEHEETIEII